MNYHWITDKINRRQHWLHAGSAEGISKTLGLVYEVRPDAFSVYGEGFQRNPFARQFLGVMPTLEEAKGMLLTITASQNI
jgi:hypothetical protein